MAGGAVGSSVFLHSIRRFSPLLQHPVAFITQLPEHQRQGAPRAE